MASMERLTGIHARYPFVNLAHHQFNSNFVQAQTAAESGSAEAVELIDRLESELESEQKTLSEVFIRFDMTKSGSLKPADVMLMMRYLGYPSSDADIQTLLKKIDKDGTTNVSFPEFENYVGCMGGSQALYGERRKRIAEKGGEMDSEEMKESNRLAMKQAGIEDSEQSYWRLVVPPAEFSEAGKMVGCQQKALATIRRLAKKNHEVALPALQNKVAKLGFKDNDLWMTLAWIRELAPIIVHLNMDKMLQFMESDTNYRNQFETATSGGLLKPAVREKWEKDLFSSCYDGAPGPERPKYGVLNVMNDYRGVVKCSQYGDSYMVLKSSRLRCTFSPEDSANLKSERLAVLDYYAHVLNEYTDDELIETLKVANEKEAAVLGDSDKVGKMKYKEAQIHGQVRFDTHVDRLVAHQRHRAKPEQAQRLRDVAAKYGWGFSWQDEEQRRMQTEDMHKLGGDAWQERLRLLEESNDGLDVPEGYCHRSCGRKVAPGETRAGRPYKTCCRGCVMGFGHDRMCGQIDASKVGPGLCKNGCGLKIAFGTDGQGRPLTTCCRGCALGMAHDKSCQTEPSDAEKAMASSRSSTFSASAAAGKCKVGCGRPVAPGKTKSGKSFDTCCRDCAQSGGASHAASCIA